MSDAELLSLRRRAYYMAMPLAVPHYTIADLDRFPEDGNRYEVLAGTLLVTPAPGPLHQVVLSRLFTELAFYLKPTGLAHPVSPGVVQTGPDTQLEPDLLVLSTHYPDDTPWRDRTAQWLAVEVSGRDSRIYDRDYKGNAYLAIGVLEVWRLDLSDRSIFVSRPGGPPDLPHGHKLVWHPPEMPAPLTIDVRALFEGYQPSARS